MNKIENDINLAYIRLNVLFEYRKVIVTTLWKNSIKKFSFHYHPNMDWMVGFCLLQQQQTNDWRCHWWWCMCSFWFCQLMKWMELMQVFWKIDVSWIPLRCWWPPTRCFDPYSHSETATTMKAKFNHIIHSTYHWMIAFLNCKIPLFHYLWLLLNVLETRTTTETHT